VMGGMSGSTSGGLKMIRVRIVAGVAARELRRAGHGRRVGVVRLGREPVSEDVAAEVAGFVLLYVLAIGIGTLAVAALGTDFPTSLGGVIAAIGLVGPGFGDAGPHSNFLVFSQPAQVILLLYQLLGRMEIYAFLLAFVAPYRWITTAHSMERLSPKRRRSTRMRRE